MPRCTQSLELQKYTVRSYRKTKYFFPLCSLFNNSKSNKLVLTVKIIVEVNDLWGGGGGSINIFVSGFPTSHLFIVTYKFAVCSRNLLYKDSYLAVSQGKYFPESCTNFVYYAKWRYCNANDVIHRFYRVRRSDLSASLA